MDLAAMYADAQSRIIALVGSLPAPALGTPVPGTPRWTVIELVAHLTGVCSDLVDGRTHNVAAESWTANQVAERAGRPVADLLAEWQDRAPALLGLLSTPGRVDASAFDILTHEHDLRGALGLAGPSDGPAVQAVTTRVTGRVSHLVDKAGLPALGLVNDNGEWVCGAGPRGLTGTASTMEWFRALFGRRSAAQVKSYGWDGDPAPYFGILNLFGPLPGADVAEAGAPAPASTQRAAPGA